MSPIDALAPLVEKLSGLLAVDDPVQLMETTEVTESLQSLISKLDEIEPSTLQYLDVDQLVSPAFTLITVIIEMGQQYDELATLPAIIWRVYVRLIRKFGNVVDNSIISKFLEILMSSCEEGLTLLKASWNDEEAVVTEHLRLLTFFIQRLTATLVNCVTFFNENPEMRMSALFVLFSFFGMVHGYVDGVANHPSQQVLSGLFQGLLKVFTSKKSQSTQPQQPSSSSADSSYSQTEITTSQVLKVDVQLLIVAITVLSDTTTNHIDGSNSYFQENHFPYASIVQHHSFAIGEGILQFAFRCFSLLSVKESDWNDSLTIRECGKFITAISHCCVHLIARQIVFHNGDLFQDKEYAATVNDLSVAISNIVAQHPVLLVVWDLFLVNALGLNHGKDHFSVIMRASLCPQIYKQLVLSVLNSFIADDMMDMIMRSFSIVKMISMKKNSNQKDLLMTSILADMIKLLPTKQKIQTIAHVFQMAREGNPSDCAIINHILLRDSLEIQTDIAVLNFLREQLGILNYTAVNGLACKGSSAASALTIATFVSAVNKTSSNVTHSNDIVSSLTSNKTIGSFSIRMLSSICRHVESRMTAVFTKDYSNDSMAKLSKMVQVVNSFADLLCFHQLPKAVQSVLLDNATKLSSALYVAIESSARCDRNGVMNKFVYFGLQAWFSVIKLVVSKEGEPLRIEELKVPFSKIAQAWNMIAAKPSHFHCGSNKATLMAMLSNSLGTSAKAFSKKTPLSLNGRNPIELSEDRLTFITKKLLFEDRLSLDKSHISETFWGHVVRESLNGEIGGSHKKRKFDGNGEAILSDDRNDHNK